MSFARNARSQLSALLVSLLPSLQSSSHDENPGKRSGIQRKFARSNQRPDKLA
jgi:hypothetical protein